MTLVNILRKATIAAACFGLGSFLNSEKASAATYNIDRTWTPQEVKNLVDGDSETFGKGRTNAQNGDIVHFLESFDLAFERDPHVRIGVPNLTIEGENTYDTIIKGGIDYSDGFVFIFSAPQSRGFVVKNMTMDNALYGGLIQGGQTGTRMSGTFQDVYFNVPQPVIVDNFKDRDSELGPNINMLRCTMQAPDIGTHESENYGVMTTQTRSFAMVDCTLRDVKYLGADVPAVCPDGGQDCPCEEKVTLEWASFDNNVFTGNGGSSFKETFYCSNGDGRPGPINDSPDFNDEYNVPETLAEHNRGIGNIDSDPIISILGFPRYGSPLIENGIIDRGAVKQMYADSNKDKKVDLRDYAKMQNMWQHDETTPKRSEVAVFDVNGNFQIDYEDHQAFVEDITGPK